MNYLEIFISLSIPVLLMVAGIVMMPIEWISRLSAWLKEKVAP